MRANVRLIHGNSRCEPVLSRCPPVVPTLNVRIPLQIQGIYETTRDIIKLDARFNTLSHKFNANKLHEECLNGALGSGNKNNETIIKTQTNRKNIMGREKI